jgi:putative phosphoesterase
MLASLLWRKEERTVRIALLSDIHGNAIALDAVIEDVRAQGDVDAYWVLGDIVAAGHDPNGVLERLAAPATLYAVRGNSDRWIVTGEQPGPTPEKVRANPNLLPAFAEIARSIAWTQGAITATGWMDWLASLPLEQRTVLPDGTRLLGVHASPGRDDGYGIYPALSGDELRSLLAGCEADLVCVGHTHWPMDVSVGEIRVVNVGCVSNPFAPDLRANYTILEAGRRGYRLEHRRVDYDHQAVIAALERVRHPAAERITRRLLGQIEPRSWAVLGGNQGCIL